MSRCGRLHCQEKRLSLSSMLDCSALISRSLCREVWPLLMVMPLFGTASSRARSLMSASLALPSVGAAVSLICNSGLPSAASFQPEIWSLALRGLTCTAKVAKLSPRGGCLGREYLAMPLSPVMPSAVTDLRQADTQPDIPAHCFPTRSPQCLCPDRRQSQRMAAEALRRTGTAGWPRVLPAGPPNLRRTRTGPLRR